MFQDLNRKLHHAEKDRESPASDSKVTHQDILIFIHFHRFSWACRTKWKKSYRNNIRGNANAKTKVLGVKWPYETTRDLCIELRLSLPGGHLNKDVFSSFLQSVRWSVSSGGSDKTNHSVSVYIHLTISKFTACGWDTPSDIITLASWGIMSLNEDMTMTFFRKSPVM